MVGPLGHWMVTVCPLGSFYVPGGHFMVFSGVTGGSHDCVYQ